MRGHATAGGGADTRPEAEGGTRSRRDCRVDEQARGSSSTGAGAGGGARRRNGGQGMGLCGDADGGRVASAPGRARREIPWALFVARARLGA